MRRAPKPSIVLRSVASLTLHPEIPSHTSPVLEAIDLWGQRIAPRVAIIDEDHRVVAGLAAYYSAEAARIAGHGPALVPCVTVPGGQALLGMHWPILEARISGLDQAGRSALVIELLRAGHPSVICGRGTATAAGLGISSRTYKRLRSRWRARATSNP